MIETNLAYQNAAAAGTGIVLTSSGEVLTNNHVINGATTVKVVIPSTGRTYSARVLGYSKTADVALLQLANASNLKTLKLGSSARVSVGQTVRALGNAGGTGRHQLRRPAPSPGSASRSLRMTTRAARSSWWG